MKIGPKSSLLPSDRCYLGHSIFLPRIVSDFSLPILNKRVCAVCVETGKYVVSALQQKNIYNLVSIFQSLKKKNRLRSLAIKKRCSNRRLLSFGPFLTFLVTGRNVILFMSSIINYYDYGLYIVYYNIKIKILKISSQRFLNVTGFFFLNINFNYVTGNFFIYLFNYIFLTLSF